jgi:ribosomal protein S18 acetylase RimI-like enzyme
MKLTTEQTQVLGDAYRFSNAEELDVMVLDTPVPTAAPVAMVEELEVRLIAETDPVESILAAYRDYPGNFFRPARMKTSVYAGAWVQGTLAAVGGTHAYAPAEGVAALGDLTTAERFRGRGLCHMVTTFLCQELQRRGCEFLGLHVARANAAGIACYRKCGFQNRGSIFQMLAEKSADKGRRP